MSPLAPNSSYVLKTGSADGSQVFERLPVNAKVIATDENGNPIDGSDNLQKDLNYVAHASLVYEGTEIQDTQYYQNPEQGEFQQKPVGSPYYYYQHGSHDPIDLLDPPLVIQYDSNGNITSPVDPGTGDSLIFDYKQNRIDKKETSNTIYFRSDNPSVRCSKPIQNALGESITPSYSSNYEDDPNVITNEIYDYFMVRVGRRETSSMNMDAIAALNVEFNIDDNWEEGDIKQFYFRSLMMPIKMNASTFYGENADLKRIHGKVILSVESEERIGFITFGSYIDIHVLEDESQITRKDRSYVVRADFRRVEDEIVLISCEYKIPYYYEDAVNGVYKQGEFTFKTPNYRSMAGTSNGSGSSGKIFYPSIKTAYKKITLNIGSDWSPSLVGRYNCWAYYNLNKIDESGMSDIHLSIKTFSNILDATDPPQ